MIEIIKKEDKILLRYTVSQGSTDWVRQRLSESDVVRFAERAFTFSHNDLIANSDEYDSFLKNDEKIFAIGVLDGDYFRISKEILGIKHDLLLHFNMRINSKTFLNSNNVSIFKKIDELIDEPIIIGGKLPQAVAKEDFYKLLESFPTRTELKHYVGSRISGQLQNYFETMEDSEEKLNRHILKKPRIEPPKKTSEIIKYDIEKYELLLYELETMLVNKSKYVEKDWQNLIADFLPFIFPKYIKVLQNLSVKDGYTNKRATYCFVDYALVDSSGAIDIVEIKQPFEGRVLSSGKYRRNFIPHQELSGAIMQAEKYIFHLNKWGQEGEKKIQEKRKKELPSGFKINILNPKALIILGLDSDFTNEQQRFDFEIIRRKYSNMIDIITYDDLLRRLKNTIFMLQTNP